MFFLPPYLITTRCTSLAVFTLQHIFSTLLPPQFFSFLPTNRTSSNTVLSCFWICIDQSMKRTKLLPSTMAAGWAVFNKLEVTLDYRPIDRLTALMKLSISNVHVHLKWVDKVLLHTNHWKQLEIKKFEGSLSTSTALISEPVESFGALLTVGLLVGLYLWTLLWNIGEIVKMGHWKFDQRL